MTSTPIGHPTRDKLRGGAGRFTAGSNIDMYVSGKMYKPLLNDQFRARHLLSVMLFQRLMDKLYPNIMLE